MDITPLSPVSMTGVRANPEDVYRELYAEPARPTGDKRGRELTASAAVALIEAVVTQPPAPATRSGLDQIA